jgi:hypothetical protein
MAVAKVAIDCRCADMVPSLDNFDYFAQPRLPNQMFILIAYPSASGRKQPPALAPQAVNEIMLIIEQ